jgi:hypothetical protein
MRCVIGLPRTHPRTWPYPTVARDAAVMKGHPPARPLARRQLGAAQGDFLAW